MEIALPQERQDAIVRYYKADGQAWIREFPILLDRFRKRWKLNFTGVSPDGYLTNLVIFAETATGQQVVLKMGYPDVENLTAIIALEAFAGRGAVRLLEADKTDHVALLERIVPGTQYRQEDPLTRSRRPLPLFRELPLAHWQGTGVPSYRDWITKATAEFVRDADYPMHREDLASVLAHYDDFESRYDVDTLLHGDLHHENILMDERQGWLAIDPKGVTGPCVMECGRYMHNFIEDELGSTPLAADPAGLQEVIGQRVRVFADVLGVPESDVISAGYVDLVTAVTWTINDGDDISDAMPILQCLRDLAG